VRKYIRPLLDKPERAPVEFRYRDLRFLARFARPVWKLGAASAVLAVIGTALGSLMPLGTKVLIDFVVLEKSAPAVERLLEAFHLTAHVPAVTEALRNVNVLVLAMLLAGGLIGIIQVSQRILNMRFEQEVVYNLQRTLFDRMLRFPLSFFRKGQTGYLVSRASDDVDVMHYFFTQTGLQVITSVFYLVFGVTILFALSLKLALIAVALLPAYILISHYFAGRQRSVGRAERERRAEVSQDMQEVFSGVEVVKSHGAEGREVRRVAGRMRSFLRTRVRAFVLQMASGYAVRGAQFLSTLVIMWFGAMEIRRGAMTIGDYVAFTTYVVYLSGSVRTLSLMHLTLQPILASLDRLMELFRTVPELPAEEKGETGTVLEKVAGEVRLENISFAYEEGKPVLRDISCTVRGGEAVALVGESGAGKTTLVNILLKFYRPLQGEISLDGHDYDGLDTRWLRGRIGVVSQDIFLFNDSIERNIRYGRPEATMEEVERAARLAHIHEEIERFPQGYGTVIGERGVVLSTGQRQRVSIARAFLREPALLILDEPTSALDAGTEKLVRDSLRELAAGRTTFIVSHRPPMLDIAARVLTLRDGRLLED
jgi:subfamily B ATP-binding cassette protein MsbA